jgi:hypothetical protein
VEREYEMVIDKVRLFEALQFANKFHRDNDAVKSTRLISEVIYLNKKEA